MDQKRLFAFFFFAGFGFGLYQVGSQMVHTNTSLILLPCGHVRSLMKCLLMGV
jgi:hypothetical protein